MMLMRRMLVILLCVLWLAACGGGTPVLGKLGAADVVLAFGDSLTHGTGAKPEDSYPAVLGGLIGRNVVRPGGLVAVIHWRSDVTTPRGPSLNIRPRPEQIPGWAEAAGLNPDGPILLLQPWHFGLKLRKP